MSNKVLGLDIGQGSVSAVLMQTGRKGQIIEGTEQLPLTDSTGAPLPLADALESIVTDLTAANTICVASIPLHHAFIRNLQVPFKNPKKIKQILPLELERSLPMPASELAIRFVELPGLASNDLHQILTAAIPREILKAYLDPLNACQVKVECLTLRPFPLAEVLNADQTLPADWLLVDLDDQWCNLVVSQQNRICFMRAFAITPQHRRDSSKLSQTIDYTLMGIENQLPVTPQPQIVWLQGAEHYAGLKRSLAQTLTLPVHTISGEHGPQRLKAGHRPGTKGGSSISIHAQALALGPTSTRGRLDYGSQTWQRYWNRDFKKSLVYRAAAIAIVLLLMAVNLGIEFYDLKMQRTHLESQIQRVFKATLPEVTRIVDPVQQMRVHLQQISQNVFADGERISNQPKIDLLLDLSEKIPRQLGIQIERLLIGPDQVRLSGTAESFNAVNAMQSGLETSTTFAKVQINSATIDKRTKRVRFQIGMTMALADQRL
jgi:Tfp pilus assembly PilM family ATPase/Tfp pilus assembly protein PilN